MMSSEKLNEKLILTCVASLVTVAVGYISYAILTTKKYLLRTRVQKLIIYPIKSLPGIEVDEICFEGSLAKYKQFYDRSWILIDEDGRKITMRTEPRLFKIKIVLFENNMELSANQMPTLQIPSTSPLIAGDSIYSVNLWGEEIEGQDQGPEINNWFRTFLGYNVKLLKHHSKFGYRQSKKLINNELHKVSDTDQLIKYSDGAPLLVINEKSVQDLNDRIRQEHGDENPAYVSSERFRPNVFFETDQPYEEDTWKYMKIGNLEFQFLVECGRCKLTTLNPITLQYEKEPLRTLKKYRMGPDHIFEGAPKLGAYFKALKTGQVRTGDPVYAHF